MRCLLEQADVPNLEKAPCLSRGVGDETKGRAVDVTWPSRNMRDGSWIFKNHLWLLPGGEEAIIQVHTRQEATAVVQEGCGG